MRHRSTGPRSRCRPPSWFRQLHSAPRRCRSTASPARRPLRPEPDRCPGRRGCRHHGPPPTRSAAGRGREALLGTQDGPGRAPRSECRADGNCCPGDVELACSSRQRVEVRNASGRGDQCGLELVGRQRRVGLQQQCCGAADDGRGLRRAAASEQALGSVTDDPAFGVVDVDERARVTQCDDRAAGCEQVDVARGAAPRGEVRDDRRLPTLPSPSGSLAPTAMT